ncbi:MAG: HU family DNA-binding protein [Sulfuriferula sp.]
MSPLSQQPDRNYSMNKAELIDAVATKTDSTKAQTAAMLDALMVTVQEALTKMDAVQLVGFGTFAVTERAGREGRNPATGKTITIPAKKVVKFKVGKSMADAVANSKAKAAKS